MSLSKSLHCFSALCGIFCVCVLNHVRLFAASWTVGHQAPLSMEFSWLEYWSGLPFPTPGDLSDLGIEPVFLCFFHWHVSLYQLYHSRGFVPPLIDRKPSPWHYPIESSVTMKCSLSVLYNVIEADLVRFLSN